MFPKTTSAIRFNLLHICTSVFPLFFAMSFIPSFNVLLLNVPKGARKYKRNVLMPPWASYNTPQIELIQYGRRIGKKVYLVNDFVTNSYDESWDSSCEQIMSPNPEPLSPSSTHHKS